MAAQRTLVSLDLGLDPLPSEIQERFLLSRNGRIESDTPASTSRALDGFLILEYAVVQLPEHVFHAKVVNLDIDTVVEEDMSYFTSLLTLDVSDNALDGIAALNTLPVLRELKCPCNGMSSLGLEPDGMQGIFEHLRFLDLSFNLLSTKDLACLASVPLLERLDVSRNELRTLPDPKIGPDTEESPPYFPSLTTFVAEGNYLGGKSIVKLAHAPNLVEIMLAGNRVERVRDLPQPAFTLLRKLDLSRNRVRKSQDVRGVLCYLPHLSIELKGNPCIVEENKFQRTTRRVFKSNLVSSVDTADSNERMRLEGAGGDAPRTSSSSTSSFQLRKKPFSAIPDCGWRQGLLPHDGDGLGGSLGILAIERMEKAFDRMERDVSTRRTSALLSSNLPETAELIFEEDEEYIEDDDEEEENASLEDTAPSSPASSNHFNLVENDYKTDISGLLRPPNPRSSSSGYLNGHYHDNVSSTSTSNAINALKFALEHPLSTLEDDIVTPPRYRSLTESGKIRNEIDRERQNEDGAKGKKGRQATKVAKQAAVIESHLGSLKDRLVAVGETLLPLEAQEEDDDDDDDDESL